MAFFDNTRGTGYKERDIEYMMTHSNMNYWEAKSTYEKAYRKLRANAVKGDTKRVISPARELHFAIVGKSKSVQFGKDFSIQKVQTSKQIYSNAFSEMRKSIRESTNLTQKEKETELRTLRKIVQQYREGKITRKQFYGEIEKYKKRASYMKK